MFVGWFEGVGEKLEVCDVCCKLEDCVWVFGVENTGEGARCYWLFMGKQGVL